MTQELKEALDAPLNPLELEEDADASRSLAAARATPVTLDEVRALAEKQLLLQVELETLESAVESKKKELKNVSEYELPTLLLEAGVPSLKLADGSTVEVQDNIFASISEENRTAAHDFIRKEGDGDLIKNVVSVTFGKGEDYDAALLLHNIKVMADNGALHFGSLEQEERVHASTLRSWVKERLKAGRPVPTETFKLFEGKKSVIKRPKKRDS